MFQLTLFVRYKRIVLTFNENMQYDTHIIP